MDIPNKNIVVVEDDASLNEALKRLLQAAGFSAETFLSAEALLETGAAQKAGCLVIDICLPGLSGFELVDRLSQRRSFTPVIFLTAHDDSWIREQAEQAGAVAYMPKPFKGQHLIDAVTRALSQI